MIGGRAERISLVVALAGALAVGLVAPAARAAENPADSFENASGSSSALVVTLIAGGTTTTAALVFMTVKLAEPSPAPAKAKEAAAAYLLANHAQMQQDLARGSGPFVDDIAAGAEIRGDHVARLGRTMRHNRATLGELTDRSKLTPDRAYEFFVRLAELCRADPVLAADFAAGGSGS